MGALTDILLENLQNLPYHPYRLIYGYVPKDTSRNNIQVAIRRLEKRGLVEKNILEDEVCIRLTSLGTEYLQEVRNKKMKKSILDINIKDEKWDGLWRVVVFDIPEKNRRVRQALRMGLRMLEFKPLQKSVWVSKINCTAELRKYIKDLSLSEYVLVFETSNLGKVKL